MAGSAILRVGLIILLAISPSLAQNLPEGVKSKVYSDFTGGLNTSKSSHLLDENESPFMQNVLIDEKPNSIVTRNGFIKAGSTSTIGKINFMFEFINEDGIKEFIISDSSVVLATKDFSTYKLLLSGLNPQAKLDAVQVRDKVWLTNGVNDVFTYNITTVTILNGNTYNLGRTPDTPNGEFIEYWLDRVWLLKDTQLDWSALTSTDTNPIAIAPDNENAWREVNRLFIGRGDGTKGTGMFICNGQLFVSKEKSIYAIFGDREPFLAKEIIKNDGIVSDDSIVYLDDFVYSVGKGGVNVSNCASLSRISDKIKTEIGDGISNSRSIISNVWERKSQFDVGKYHSSTSTLLNIEVLTMQTSAFYLRQEEISADINLKAPTTSTVFITIVSSAAKTEVPLNYSGTITTITFTHDGQGDNLCTDGTLMNVQYIFLSTRTSERSTFQASFPLTASPTNLTTGIASGFTITYDDIVNNRIQYKVVLDTSNCTSSGNPSINFSLMGESGNKVRSSAILSTDTAQFVSEITTITTITSWDNFETEHNLNGGSIRYYYKVSTSAVNIATQTWISINPGSIINSSSTNNYIQWSTTMAASNLNNFPQIDKVEIKHNEGRSSFASPFGIAWKNRYWIFISSDTNGNLFNGYIKSLITNPNPNAWMYFSGIPVFSIGTFSNNLYGGGNGVIYRLDYGTNDNGVAVDAIYRTPDSLYGNLFQNKKIKEYFVDANRESNKSIDISFRVNFGDYSLRTKDFNGSGRQLRNYIDIETEGNTIGWQFRNNQLDKNLELYNFAILYTEPPYRSGR